jgi:glycosyltransferase involved in cell wall biosynthesis
VTAGVRSIARVDGGRRTRGLTAHGAPGKPLVTVVTVVRNRADRVEETIKAVLGQNYRYIEYLIVDGASTDGTVDVLRRYDDRIGYWISEPDSGIYEAMNKAIDLVTDPEAYILFANSDDRLYSPDAIRQLVEGGEGADLVHGKMTVTDGEASRVYGRDVTLKDLAGRTLCHPATIMRRRVFDEVGRFDTSFTIAADYDLIVRCFAHPVTTKFVPEIISRMSMGGISEDRFMLSCQERKRVVRSRFKSITRFAGVWRVNLYDIPRNAARQWLARAGLLSHWRALKQL